ncbi:hypothetical protein D4S03_01835 [bacterium]|nr:MAG: hypothetical protein D4S03_01835 [bacterium]
MLPEPITATIAVTATLEKLGVRYLICGSLASTVHGMVRTTQDSDIVAELRPEHVAAFVRALEGEFYVDAESIASAVAGHTSFNIIHRESMFKVDVFIPALRPFVKEQLARARKQVFAVEPHAEALVATAEDTLLAKLEWYRMGGEVSERQWRDVLGILKIQAENLDLDYLREWAKELKVSDLLKRALTESAF